MIEHKGIIKEVFSDKVIVQTEQFSACSGCYAKQVCSAFDKKERLMEIAISGKNFRIGDAVNITGKSSLGLSAVWYAFALPLILMLLPFTVKSIRQNEGIASLTAFGILIIYYVILYAFRNKLKRKFVWKVSPKAP